MDTTDPDPVATVVLAAAGQIAGRPLTLDSDLLGAGFDSLSILEFVTLVSERLGVKCTFEDAFDAASLDELAARLRDSMVDLTPE
jgi:acyl carrier protein